MRSLKESLLDDDLDVSIDKLIKDDIKAFLKENFKGHSKCKISRKPNSDGKYEVSSNGNISHMVSGLHGQNLTNGRFVWTVVNGDFNCSCSMGSLEGGPRKVTGDFYMASNKYLTNLKGAPEEVGGSFNCNYSSSLESLEGAPKKVGVNFTCNYCLQLTSLEGAPEEVHTFYCCHNKITSLKGCPKVVNQLNFSGCKQLTSLKGAPKEVYKLCITDCKSLTSLEGAPKILSSSPYSVLFSGTKFSREEIEKAFKISSPII